MLDLGIQWHLHAVELGLLALSGIAIVLDLLLPQSVSRGRTISSIVLVGLFAVLGILVLGWGEFGQSFRGAFVQDGPAFAFKLLFILTGIYVLQMVREYQIRLDRGHSEFVVLILFALTGMCFLASANELLLFFVSLETVTVSLFIITAYLRDDARSIEAGIKFLVLGALATAVMVLGMSFVFGSAGSTYFDAIRQELYNSPTLQTGFTLGAVLMLAALSFKIASFPFQFWAPDVYEGAPAPITAFLAIGSKLAGFAALSRLTLTLIDAKVAGTFAPVLIFSAAATLLYGNLGALRQTNIKRLLAYSSIGHAGYLLLAILSFRTGGAESLLVYLSGYLFSSAAVFLVVVWVANHLQTEEIQDYSGLSRRSPILAATLLLGLCSLAGVPPLAGFFGKFYVLSTAYKAGFGWLVGLGLICVVISLYYYLSVVKAMYLEEPIDPKPLRVDLAQAIALYSAQAGILFLGIYPNPLVHFARETFLKTLLS